MTKRFKGNPNWGKPMLISNEVPSEPSAFERMIERLKLKTEQEQLRSLTLRDWVKRNYKTRYVPEELLLRMGLVSQYDIAEGFD
jgi:hypothetical protein